MDLCIALRPEVAQRAFDFGMAGMANQNHTAPSQGVALHLLVHLGHQRAGGVQLTQPQRLGFVRHAARHTMGAEDDPGFGGQPRQIVDEDRALLAQAVHHVAVVHDLVAHVDRRSKLFQSPLHHEHGALNARTKATRIGDHDVHE